MSGNWKGNTQEQVKATEDVNGGQVHYREGTVNRSGAEACLLSLLWEMTHLLEQKAQGPEESEGCFLSLIG